MKTTFVRTLLGLGAVLVVTLAPWQAHAASCSTASTAGRGAYTYTGTILTTSGLLPVASVGQFSQDAVDLSIIDPAGGCECPGRVDNRCQPAGSQGLTTGAEA